MAENEPGTPPAETPPTPEPTSPPPAEPEFAPITSQEQFDRMVGQRVKRAEKKYAGYDELKAKAEQFDQLQEANRSELEKAQNRAAQLEQEAERSRLDAQEQRLRSAIVSEAARKNVIDPDAALALVDRSSLEFDDGGDPTNIATAMDDLLAAKPYLAGGTSARPNGADQGARTGTQQISRAMLSNMSPEEITMATQEGRLDHILKGQ